MNLLSDIIKSKNCLKAKIKNKHTLPSILTFNNDLMYFVQKGILTVFGMACMHLSFRDCSLCSLTLNHISNAQIPYAHIKTTYTIQMYLQDR